MTYKNFLNQVPPFGETMGLDGIKALLNELGNFHHHMKIIHIAGTNGKGSSTMMLASILKESGLSVGTFTSPYIDDYRECIHINGEMISEILMSEITLEIEIAYEKLKTKELPLPTHYECLTCCAFLAMYRSYLDISIIEVLMGGLMDATNVFTNPFACLITSISLDHTYYLGDTLEKIALQKAGIIKKGCPVFINQNSNIVQDTIITYAKEQSAPYFLSSTYISSTFTPGDFQSSMKLIGDHQLNNLEGVLAVILYLRKSYTISQRDIHRGLQKTCHFCRLELIPYHDHLFLLDGSHNEDGINALMSYLNTYHPKTDLIFVFGLLKDKDSGTILPKIYSFNQPVILTTPINPRAQDPSILYSLLNDEDKTLTVIEPNLNNALNHAINLNKKRTTQSIIIVCGSLSIACPARNYLIQKSTHLF